MDEKIKEYLARVTAEVDKAFEGFIGHTAVTEASLAAICDSLRQVSCLQEAPRADDDHLQFMVGVRHDEVVPANLYTAMRMMYGVHAPSWSACEGGSWTAPDGTCYEWRDGSTYATVARPMSVIDITLKVEGDEKHG